jgi:WD40 repeat protein
MRSLIRITLVCFLTTFLWGRLLSSKYQVILSTDASSQFESITVANASQIQNLFSIQETGMINALSFSPDDKLLASPNSNGEVHLIDTETGELSFALINNDSIKSAAFSPDGRTLAVGTQPIDGGDVILWNLANKQIIATLKGHTGWVNSVSFSPDGSKLASGSSDGTIRLWDIETMKSIATLKGHTGWVNSVSFSPDGSKLASGSSDGTIRLWDVETLKSTELLNDHDLSDRVWDIKFNPEGTFVASGNSDKIIKLTSISDSYTSSELKGHSREVLSLSFNGDGTVLGSIAMDDTLRLWNVETGISLLEIPFNNILGMQSVQFSHDGKLLAIGISGQLQLWGIPD